MSARNLEACFVPTFLPSNMTDEEFINMLDNCLPRAIVTRIEELRGNTQAVEKALAMLDEIDNAIPSEDELRQPSDFDSLSIAELRRDYTECAVIFAKFKVIDKHASAIRTALEDE